MNTQSTISKHAKPTFEFDPKKIDPKKLALLKKAKAKADAKAKKQAADKMTSKPSVQSQASAKTAVTSTVGAASSADSKAFSNSNKAIQLDSKSTKPESDTVAGTSMSLISTYNAANAHDSDIQDLQNKVERQQKELDNFKKHTKEKADVDDKIANQNTETLDRNMQMIDKNLGFFKQQIDRIDSKTEHLTNEVNTLKQQKQVAQAPVLSAQQLKTLAENIAVLVQPAQQPATNSEDLKNHLNLQLAPITQLVKQQNQQIDQQGKQIDQQSKQIEQLTQQLTRQSEQSAQLVQYITQLSQQVNISAPTQDSLTLSLSQPTAHGRSKSQPARSVNTSFQSEQQFARQSSTLNQSLPQVSSASYHEPVNEPVGSQFLKSQAYPTSTEQQQAQEQRLDNLLNSDKYPAPEQPKNGAQNLLDSAAYNNAQQQPTKQKINTQQLIKDLDAVATDADITANQQLGNADMLSSGAYAEPQKPAAKQPDTGKKQPQAKKNAFHTLFAKKQQPQANFDDDGNHVRPRQVKVQAFSFENRQNSTLQIMAEQCVVL